ncbi:phage integrase N-terminal SAM-like domain-containing protein [Apilactobacillus timberlakei]|uniref:Recombinase XerD n=1 Tax=Apilactobacillus timberlakei TaxID=2008380 RepID=A0ABY2YXX4_9LACO|nr:phage integrase N-terminal SAM-like domain-containing protein [Apilactobacillus timberlakei]TPR13894.1 recombinase XerD [Apilactobacillus timberlakei]TPR15210.1 recombinase XerD [Apilactobacillus timberlakei]TPR17101.1 recombinase XerD [Apilactobacillus timberlakei]TPR17503.1 recombinase XerD [Apilactobacillus timberlakei]TPR20094.1 recombinase XerD [Apilactobacillus timberlakei]
MTTNNYPYQKSFEKNLNINGLAKVTIKEYTSTLIDMFEYLSNFNIGYQKNHHVNQLFDRDIQQYMNMLVEKRQINNSTYNKVLSHINIYFKYLFSHDFSDKLPTLTLKGRDRNKESKINIKWIEQMPNILNDPNVHPYTKMTLLLISKGFKSSEFLKINFYRVFKKINFNSYEKKFINQYNNFIKPIQGKQSSKDIFLKQRIANDPHLTLPGLHKYLKPSEEYLSFSLNPTDLFQGYILNYVIKNPGENEFELSNHLNLDLASVIYYKKLSTKIIND